VTGRVKGSGLSSGVPIDSDWTYLVILSGRRVTREQTFFDRNRAFGDGGHSA
jgi:hypothetical protein